MDEAVPVTLAATQLYADFDAKTLHGAVRKYVPRYALWSDGVEKDRWIYVPECLPIDSSDINDWKFPVGTRFWKEFRMGSKRLETRLIERYGEGPNDFFYATYAWSEDQSEATLVQGGSSDVLGSEHDIPSETKCRACHGPDELNGGRPSRALGFSSLQLGGAGEGWRLADLMAEGRLTVPPMSAEVSLPGDATAQAALGYLHVNCGTCHNPSADGVSQVDLNLWLDLGIANVNDTAAYKTAVGVANQLFNVAGVTARIEPGKPEQSSLVLRMEERGNNAQMPPLASEKSDPVGLKALRDWIESLP